MLHFPDVQRSGWRDNAPVSSHWEAAGTGNLGGSSPEPPAEFLAVFDPSISWDISWCLAGLLSHWGPSLSTPARIPPWTNSCPYNLNSFFKGYVMTIFGAVK